MNKTQFLFVSDLDGTILTHEKTITSENMAAVKALRENGSDITIATGRSVESARRYVGMLDIKVPVIVYNGVVIYDYQKEKILWNDMLPHSARSYIDAIKKAFPQVGIEILREDKVYVIQTNRHVYDHLNIEKIKYTEKNLEDVPDEWFKVLIAADEDEMPRLAAFTSQMGPDDVYFVQTYKNYYEMLPKGSSKGTALEKLCRITDFSMENTAAVGDFNNDIDMISKAGIGAAMGNAPDSIKKWADIVVKSNEENGFAQFVYHVLNANKTNMACDERKSYING